MAKVLVCSGLIGLIVLLIGLGGCLHIRQAPDGVIWQTGQSGDAPGSVSSLWLGVISPSMALAAMFGAAFAYRRKLKGKKGWVAMDREDMALLRTARDALTLFLGKHRRIAGCFFTDKGSPGG